MKTISTLFVTLLFIASNYAQIRVGDVVIPYKVSFDKEELKLNGAGIRKVIGVDTYSGGLYTKKKYTEDRAVLDSDETMSIRINIISKRVTNKRMIKVFRKGFDDAMFGNTETIAPRIESFLELFRQPTKVNDYFDMVYFKGKGIKTYKNGEEVGFIEGRDFKYALFKIWLGNQPACEYIKGGMLGKSI